MNHAMMQTGINAATPSSASKRKPEKSATLQRWIVRVNKKPLRRGAGEDSISLFPPTLCLFSPTLP